MTDYGIIQANSNEGDSLACRWMKTTEPSSLQVPPWRSTCNIRRICKKRMPLGKNKNGNSTASISAKSKKVSSVMFVNKIKPHYLTAEVAKTCPLEPTERTMTEATTTIKSVVKNREEIAWKSVAAKQSLPWHNYAGTWKMPVGWTY